MCEVESMEMCEVKSMAKCEVESMEMCEVESMEMCEVERMEKYLVANLGKNASAVSVQVYKLREIRDRLPRRPTPREIPAVAPRKMYDNKFFDYLRMSIKSFDELIELIRQDISCSETHLRPSVSPEEKLVITLRYLGTDCSFGELSYNYRLGKSTITGIVREVCLFSTSSINSSVSKRSMANSRTVTCSLRGIRNATQREVKTPL
ncbi:hypothetical protein HW555_009989 [Spodoptera exigua]|uniref:Transposase Helix-turn-helix domain-containing protein n=1 Tax=Spodoptera exigua TaxID=7107 RepID=A0A835G9Z1_SPOEX|nr:hypothetical protein HW555_009989 [Spodoptera exigua]